MLLDRKVAVETRHTHAEQLITTAPLVFCLPTTAYPRVK